MKKLLLIALIAVNMAGVAHADTAAPSSTAQPSSGAATTQTSASGNFVPLAPIPGLTQGVVANSSGLANFLNNLYKYLVGAAAILAVIMIIWGGLEISTKDSVSKKSDGKARITQAIFGLILVLSPVIVFSIINPSILNLSLNLPPIAISPGTYGGGAPQTATVNPTTGCSVTGVSGILQIATCPSDTAASVWGQQNCSWGELSGQPKDLGENSSGAVTSAMILCTTSQSYTFIDLHTSSFTSAINRLTPLVQSSTDPNNGASVMQFVSICGGAGMETCISNDPSLSSSITCPPITTQNLPPSAPKKCYAENLSCETPYNSITSALNTYCSVSPSWSPLP